MKILGIESSCDETAVSIVEDGKKLLSNIISSSMDIQVLYGGVVPELAARNHLDVIITVIKESFEEAGLGWCDIDAIAVVNGAGLGGSLLIGVMTARTLAILFNKPLYSVNHVLGHIYANYITETKLPNYSLPSKQPVFPILGLIVSGGHSQLVLMEDYFKYKVLGRTLDDAVGEAFDKVAKIIGLPYPGGPSVEKLAKPGDSKKYSLPKAKMKEKYDFSFSGPKTAVLRLAQELIGEDYNFPSYKLSERLTITQKQDIAASFARTALETIVDKAELAFKEYNPKTVVIGGGVASSPLLRQILSDRLPKSANILYTDPKLCTDNGAIAATLGYFEAKFSKNLVDPYKLTIEPNLFM